MTFKPCLPAALFIWFDAFMWATLNINSHIQTVAAIFDNAALDDLCYPCLLQIDFLTPNILQGTIRINTWEALRKLSSTWNQAARHDHETFLTSCFHQQTSNCDTAPASHAISHLSSEDTEGGHCLCRGGRAGEGAGVALQQCPSHVPVNSGRL